jgi:lipocalin
MKKLLLSLILSASLFICKAQLPTITSINPASGAVGTLVTITGTNLSSPAAFSIGGTNAIAVSNNGTQLVGMVMPGATNGMASVTTAGGTVSKGYFTVTPTSYPQTQQGSKLVGAGATTSSTQGYSVALSSDGYTAIVGGNMDNSGTGAAWIFIRLNGVWLQQGSKLVGTGSIGSASQGTSVSLSSDGNTALVGGYMDNSYTGAVWIYIRSGGVWTQQGSKLVGTGAIGSSYNSAQQGISASLSADGNIAMVGGPNDNSGIGAVWTYTRLNGVWTQQGNKLVSTGTTYRYGQSVSLSSDGNTSIVGSRGTVWIYTRSNGVWTPQASNLVGTGATGNANIGQSVSLSSDGNTAIVGGPSDNNSVGAAWIYTRSSGVWSQQGNKLVGTGVIGAAYQGQSVSLSSDGNTAIVGGYADNGGIGAVWIFTLSGGVWTQQGNKLVGTGASGSANQGRSVSLSLDGNTAIMGGSSDNDNAGAVWIYTRSAGIWSQQGNKLVGKGAAYDTYQGASVAISANGNTAILGGYRDSSNAGAAWIYTRSNGVWTQQGSKLVGTGATGRANQGASVALSADGNTAIVGGPADNEVKIYSGSGIGAAWIYTRLNGVWTQQGNKLVGTGTINYALQGHSVSLSSDGNTAIVGGYADNGGVGAAWFFTRSGGVWTQQGSKLVGTGAIGNAWQGTSVSLSADGNTAIMGGYYDNSNIGAVWIFTRSGGVWTQQGSKLVGTGTLGTIVYQGSSVSLSSDGNTAMVGGPNDNYEIGAVWIYTRSGGVWTQQGSKLVGTGAVSTSVYQGSSVSLSSDGNTAMVGGPNDNYYTGAVWIYTRSGGLWTQKGSKVLGIGAIGAAQQGSSLSLSSDGTTAIIGGPYDNNSLGAAWIYTSSSIVTAISQVEETQNHLTIYPNPNNGLCTVQSDNEGVYTVLNPLGQTVHTFRLDAGNNYMHNISNLDNGIYFIVGDGSNGRTSKKMVVAK